MHSAKAEEPGQAAVVTTKPLGELLIYPVRDAPATAVSLNDTRIDAEIKGIIKDILVRVGDKVSSGETVARLDCQDNAIEVAQASAAVKAGQAKHDFSRSQLENAKKLSTKRNISKEELERRESEARASQAELERLTAVLRAKRRTLEKCDILAPFNAVIVERMASLGDYVTPGTPIVRLLDVENIEVVAKVQEQDLESMQGAKELHFVNRGKSFPVKLRTILPVIDSRIRSYEVRLTFLDRKMAPGSVGRLRWLITEGRLSNGLLLNRQEGLGIFVMHGNRAKFIVVEDVQAGQPVSIDLPPDIEVIVKGRFGLTDGMPVKVNEH